MGEFELLELCKQACASDPQSLTRIVQACTEGIKGEADKANRRAADFEVVAALMRGLVNEKRLTAETKAHYNNTICKKLKKWEGKSALNWEGE